MKVSLAFNPDLHRPPNGQDDTIAKALLSPSGPRVILGGQNAENLLAAPITPRADTMFGPRGAVLAGPEGPLIACDTGHHRLMIWRHLPKKDNTAADFIIGHSDVDREGRNGKGAPTANTLNVPTGIATDGKTLAVADAWNHRVLLWLSLPTAQNQPADVVLGQAGFGDVEANRAGNVEPETLNWCYGIAIIEGKLVVADTGNRRVLIWNEIPRQNGAPADMVVGQCDFTTRDENAGIEAGGLGMCWPHSIASVNGKFLVSDAGNNRIMVWNKWPDTPGIHCDYVLGQKDKTSSEHNRAAYLPDARALNMPYGMALLPNWLVVSDTANSRLVGYRPDDLSADAPATALAAQKDFFSKGDNRWKSPARDSLCWPYWVSASGKTLVIADSGNNRIMLWDQAE